MPEPLPPENTDGPLLNMMLNSPPYFLEMFICSFSLCFAFGKYCSNEVRWAKWFPETGKEAYEVYAKRGEYGEYELAKKGITGASCLSCMPCKIDSSYIPSPSLYPQSSRAAHSKSLGTLGRHLCTALSAWSCSVLPAWTGASLLM